MYGERSNRPKSGPLFQQQLKAWKPLMTYKDASIFFIVTGFILVGIGVAIYFADQKVYLYSVDYTDCFRFDTGRNTSSPSLNLTTNYSCKMDVEIKENIPLPVFFYYDISNYYQNHRQLLKSYDISQLRGNPPPPSSRCEPLKQDVISLNYYAPCGDFPNVIFNDTFLLQKNNETVPWTNKGIALNSDLRRYANPDNWNNTIKPPNWEYPINGSYPNGYAGNENLMVWMRSSPLPTIRKLHHILDPIGNYKTGLPSGNYSILIDYKYLVKTFGGRKSFVISNTSWMGGKNQFMSILYFLTGIIEILIGIIFIPIHVNYIINSMKPNSALMSVEM